MRLVKGLAFATILSTTGAFAATSGTLYLKGTVPALLSISVSPESVASSLPLNTSQTDTKVASVNETSNSNTGYEVSISSQNAGKLVHESVSSSSINYSLKYGTSSVNLASGQTFTYASPASVNKDSDISITYTGVPHASLIQGDYEDTVTFTIAAH